MKNTFKTPLHKVCSNDALRPALQCVYIKGGYAYATDGHVAVRQALTEHGLDAASIQALEGKVIHKAVYARLLKHSYVTFTDTAMLAQLQGLPMHITYHYSKMDEPHVNIAKPIEQALAAQKDSSHTYTMLNPKLLKQATDALVAASDNAVVIQTYSKTKAIVVHTGDVEEQVAILMPIHRHNSPDAWQ